MDCNQKYILYGAGGDSLKLIPLLKENGCVITAIIDKRAFELNELLEIPVILPEDLEPQTYSLDSIIIITIKNVFEHSNIAKELYVLGYQKLVYKPLSVLKGFTDSEWDSINSIYSKMIVEKQFPSGTTITSKEPEIFCGRLDSLYIKEVDNMVTAYLPSELLCNYDTDAAWGRIGMQCFFPMVDLYKVLLNDTPSVTWIEAQHNYLLYCGEWLYKHHLEMTKGQKESFIHSRVNIFYEMQKKSGISQDFFIQNAPEVIWQEQNIFYISSSGRNRIAFQIAKGYNYVPVSMSKLDYMRWINEKDSDNFLEILKKNKVNKLFTSIPHPMFIDFPIIAEDYVRLVCGEVTSYLLKDIYLSSTIRNTSYSIVDMDKVRNDMITLNLGIWVADQGCLSRYLNRLFINHIRINNKLNEPEQEITLAIDNLLQSKRIKEISSTNIKWDKLQYLVIDSRVSTSIPEQFIGRAFFYIDWGESEIPNQNLINQNFRMFQEFFLAIWDNQIVRGYIYERNY